MPLLVYVDNIIFAENDKKILIEL